MSEPQGMKTPLLIKETNENGQNVDEIMFGKSCHLRYKLNNNNI
jgi:hypothetical protein